MPFKGKRNGSWLDASAVYGKSGGSWLYGKEAWAKKDGSWQRAWTDCRLFDQGGRDWSAPTVTSVYNGSCLGRTRTDTTTRTKTGCPNDSRAVTVADPTCGTVGGACYSDVTQAYLNAYGLYQIFSFNGKDMFLYRDCATNLWAQFYTPADDPCVNSGCSRARLLQCSSNQYVAVSGCGDCGIFC